MEQFTHLHVYTGYTIGKGICDIEKLVREAQEFEMKALAITDKNVMSGVPEFCEVCRCCGIKPIIGCEVTVGTAEEQFPLVLLCETETGYKNLVRLLSNAWAESDGVTPVVNITALWAHNNGLIALSAGLDGEIATLLLDHNYEKAKEAAFRFKRIFGEDCFFIELQNHGLAEEQQLLGRLAALADETGLKTVATNAVHYVEREDAEAQNVCACIALELTEREYAGKGLRMDEYYFKNEDEMRECFREYENAVLNSGVIADRCSALPERKFPGIPKYDTPHGEAAGRYFREICMAGLKERMGGKIPPEYEECLEYEVLQIRKMGCADYFLLVWDVICFAKNQGIPVGPGRGAAPGSLALYACGITEIDPIKYGLCFERFMNPERAGMPVIEIDICCDQAKEEEIVGYLKAKYGGDCVLSAPIFDRFTMGRAIARVSSAIDIDRNETIDLIEQNPYNVCTVRALAAEDTQIARAVDIAKKLEYLPSAQGIVAWRVHFCSSENYDLIPTMKTPDWNGEIQTTAQYEKRWLDKLGVIHLNLLGLRVLNTLRYAENRIRERTPKFDLSKIDLSDPDVYTMLGNSNTDDIFLLGFSSQGKHLLRQCKPSSLEDLAVLIGLDRPGPDEFLQAYIEAKGHPETVKYRMPALEPILKNTCGIIVYQEQILEILHTLAGYSMARADLARRAIAKRMPEVLKLQREFFVHGSNGKDGLPDCDGCLKRGIDEKTANAVFDDIEKCCSYAFNKSHSISYALLSYQTAYLKCHYPEEWEAAIEKSAATDY